MREMETVALGSTGDVAARAAREQALLHDEADDVNEEAAGALARIGARRQRLHYNTCCAMMTAMSVERLRAVTEHVRAKVLPRM